jgi:hypothetical protein
MEAEDSSEIPIKPHGFLAQKSIIHLNISKNY